MADRTFISNRTSFHGTTSSSTDSQRIDPTSTRTPHQKKHELKVPTRPDIINTDKANALKGEVDDISNTIDALLNHDDSASDYDARIDKACELFCQCGPKVRWAILSRPIFSEWGEKFAKSGNSEIFMDKLCRMTTSALGNSDVDRLTHMLKNAPVDLLPAVLEVIATTKRQKTLNTLLTKNEGLRDVISEKIRLVSENNFDTSYKLEPHIRKLPHVDDAKIFAKHQIIHARSRGDKNQQLAPKKAKSKIDDSDSHEYVDLLNEKETKTKEIKKLGNAKIKSTSEPDDAISSVKQIEEITKTIRAQQHTSILTKWDLADTAKSIVSFLVKSDSKIADVVKTLAKPANASCHQLIAAILDEIADRSRDPKSNDLGKKFIAALCVEKYLDGDALRRIGGNLPDLATWLTPHDDYDTYAPQIDRNANATLTLRTLLPNLDSDPSYWKLRSKEDRIKAKKMFQFMSGVMVAGYKGDKLNEKSATKLFNFIHCATGTLGRGLMDEVL